MVTLETAQILFVNHSGGKDSQALLCYLISLGFADRIVVVHADLGEMEHEEMKPWIESISFGLPVHVVKPERDFFQLARDYKRIPDGRARFCTSKLKTDPVAKFIRAYMEEHQITHALNVLGIRCDESAARADTEEYEKHQANAVTLKRFVATWNPIRLWSVDDVWAAIKKAGQQPHRVYSEGWSRLSCVFCVLGKKSEHIKAAKARPDLFKKMVALERELGKTIRLKQINKKKFNHYLDEYITGV